MNKEPTFTISGQQDILNRLIINVRILTNDKGTDVYEMQTFIYKGEILPLKLDDPRVIRYELFASYDELVGKSIGYDNVMRFTPREHINYVDVNMDENGLIYISHSMNKDDIKPESMSKIATIGFYINETFDEFIKSEKIEKGGKAYLFYKDSFFNKYE